MPIKSENEAIEAIYEIIEKYENGLLLELSKTTKNSEEIHKTFSEDYVRNKLTGLLSDLLQRQSEKPSELPESSNKE